jgi:hypothetical protein
MEKRGLIRKIKKYINPDSTIGAEFRRKLFLNFSPEK